MVEATLTDVVSMIAAVTGLSSGQIWEGGLQYVISMLDLYTVAFEDTYEGEQW